MMAVAKVVITKLMMLVIGVLSTPVDFGETIRIDRLENNEIAETFELQRGKDGYSVFQIEDGERKRHSTLKKKVGNYLFVSAENTMEEVDLEDAVPPGQLKKLPRAAELTLNVSGGSKIHVKRSGKLVFLRSSADQSLFVVRTTKSH